MIWLDWIILLVLAAGLVRGFTTGMVRQAISLVGQILAFLLAVQLMRPVGELVTESLGVSATLGPLLGFVTVFLAIQIVVYAIEKIVESIVGALKLGGVNRLLGGAFGAFKAAVVLSVAFLVVDFFDLPDSETRDTSTLYEPVAAVLPGAWDFVSERVPQVERLSEKFGERVEQQLPTSSP